VLWHSIMLRLEGVWEIIWWLYHYLLLKH